MNEESDRTLRERPRLDYYESSNSELDESSTSVESNTSFATALTVGDDATASIDNNVFVSMDNPRCNQLVAELETIFFQLEEIKDIVEDELGTMSLKNATSQYDELKELRINMVRFGQELKLLSQGEDPNDVLKKVEAAGQFSKEHLKTIKNRVSELERINSDQLSEAREAEYQRLRSKRLAFETMVKEINGMYVRLYAAYTAKPVNLSRDEMLKRKEDKPILASEFDRFRERVDKLVSTDIFFEQKEKIIEEVVHLLSMLETNKFAYEKKVYDDLVANDLTDDKRKLAELTTIDIGYFSGELGEDFYTFKSKFLKAYERHPKSLMVDWLKNNHLKGKAKSCVGSLDEIDGIWKRLKDNYGNTEQMLLYHFDRINRLGTMNKQKSYTLKKQYLQTLINSMQDAIDLAKEHKLEGELHYGPQLGKIVTQLESYMQNAWFKLITEQSVAKPNRWMRLIIFMESQLSIIQTRAFEAESADLQLAQQLSKSDIDSKRENDTKHVERLKKPPLSLVVDKEECGLCSETHYSANKSYFNCKRFLTITRKERCALVRNNKHCLQCLHSKSRWNEGEHECSNKWICKNDSHNKHEKKLHFFICEFHTDDNNQLFEEWKVEILKAEWQKNMFKNRSYIVNSIYLNKKTNIPEIQESDVLEPEVKGNEKEVSMPSGQEKSVVEETPKVEPTLDVIPDAVGFGSPVFLLQPVPYNDHVFNFFYDSGCKNFVSRKTAIDMLPDTNKRNTVKGPIAIYGVGGATVTSQYGHYSIDFPIHDGRMATFSGLCLDTITGGMPPYPVREARKTLVEEYVAGGGKESELPQVPLLVGGDTDFLMGPQYNWFLPRLLFILPSCLAIYESMFVGVDGTSGCIGARHNLFPQCEEQFCGTHTVTEFRAYLTQQLSLYSTGYRVCLDHDSLTLKNVLNPHRIAIVNIDSELKTPKALLTPTTSNDAEAAGSVIEYKCIKCRGCNDCKRGEHIENVSVREEYEQHIIDNSVSVDFDKQQTIATLPFIADPVEKLQSNEENANRVYSQQLKKLSKVHHSVKDAVIESEMKLQKSGHVEWIKNLPTKELDMLNSFVSKYYMPWRFVFNENSISTPVRVVFDASSISRSGYSLNDLLAKGINSINSLLKIFLRFRCAPVAVHTDIKKMCGPFNSYSKHNKRATVKVWISVYVCTTTSMTNLKVMDGYDTTQFLMAFSRFACEVGFPSKLLVDPGSQVVKGCEEMSLNMCNMRGALKRECGVDFDKCPVGGHNYQGKVERKIRVIKESISETAHLQRLTTLQWETLCSEIANSINNHPVAIGNETQDLESLDLITPNRLRLGRNNDRSPVGTLDLTDKIDRILKMNSDIFNTWWENWLVSALPKIVPKPKWFKNDEHLKVGDIVLFNKGEGSLLAGEYQYGAVEKVHASADGRICSVTIRYRNSTEGVNRNTTRAVRSLIVIHRIDELNIMEELGKASFINSQEDR